MMRHISGGTQRCQMRTDLFSKTDLPSSQQQNAAVDLDVVLLQNVQILQAAVVAIHKSPLETQAAGLTPEYENFSS